MLTWILAVGLGVALGALMAIALTVVAWVIDKIISGIVTLIRKVKARIMSVRIKKGLKGFESLAREQGEIEIAEAFAQLQEANQGLALKVNESGQEEWDDPQVIAAESAECDMGNVTLVAADGRYQRV